MTLQTLANIADLLAAFGVIASLVFLAVELRISNREARMANWRQLLESLRQYKAISNDPHMADLIERGEADYHALGPAERRSYGMYVEQGIHVIGNFSKHTGKVPVELTGLDGAVDSLFRDLLTTPGARAWWAETRGRKRFLPMTHRMIDELLEAGDA